MEVFTDSVISHRNKWWNIFAILDRVGISRNWATACILVLMVTLGTVVVKGG